MTDKDAARVGREIKKTGEKEERVGREIKKTGEKGEREREREKTHYNSETDHCDAVARLTL